MFSPYFYYPDNASKTSEMFTKKILLFSILKETKSANNNYYYAGV